MSIDPDKELSMVERVRHPAWSYCFLFAFLLLLQLWAFLLPGCLQGGSGRGAGSGAHGTYLHGQGPGSGKSGKGQGAGTQGTGTGKLAAAGKIGIGDKKDSPGAAGARKKDLTKTVGGDRAKNTTATLSVAHLDSITPTQQQQNANNKIKFGGSNAGVSGSTGGGFYGIQDSGRTTRTLFIVDTSGSMAAVQHPVKGKKSSSSKRQSRMDILQSELKKSIFTTGIRHGGFSIIAFHHGSNIFGGSKICSYNDSSEMKRAEIFINSLRPGGGTGFRQAWNNAIKIINNNKIDNVFFLTDGFGDTNDVYILDLLKKSIPDSVVVNCISIGSDRPFMKNIAEKRKGKYVVKY